MASVSSDDNDFFEGTEKLLEVWFDSVDGNGDLRDIKRQDWVDLLDNVHCTIISETSDSHTDSYVLSESSMFVTEKRFILKTCGTTTLLYAVKPLLKLVKEQCGMTIVKDVFYSRKKFERPELQHEMHQSFEDEVQHLDKLFDNGAAYALGRLNADCWYLYTLNNSLVFEPDQTLEVLMQDLDQDVMNLFTMDRCPTAEQATRESGISDLMPGAIIDDFMFEPCGYSMNAILPEGKYFTIHITPEPHCSYVSFETNVAQESYYDLTVKLLKIFRPGKFLLTLFANKESIALSEHVALSRLENLAGFNRTDHQFCAFKNYELTYAHYVAKPAPIPPPPI